jgi:GntR family transcriptional regulator/MocR family aminotransferase
MKRAPNLDLADIAIDRGGPQPLAGQLYASLRSAILSGQLRPGTRLPATRVLAQEVSVSRNTVIAAFEQLEMGVSRCAHWFRHPRRCVLA